MAKPDRVEVPVHYRAGHTYVQQMVPTDLYCPACGKLKVWVEDNEGDYYQGPTHVCTWCGASFCIQGPSLPTKSTPADDPTRQLVEALRAAGK